MESTFHQKTLPSEAFKGLTCSHCKKPLSRFPIYIHLKFQHCVCGRCSANLTDMSDYARNVTYEQLAEYIRFDCCHKPDGCLRLLFPADMENHEEKHCDYLKYNCALGKDQCSWYGFHNEHLEHFRQNHEDFVLNGKQVTIDFNNSYEQKYLLANGEELFVVKMQNCLTLKKFSCVVYCIRKSFNTEDLYCKLELSDLNANFTVQISRKVNEIYEISNSGLSHSFCNDQTVNLRVLHMEVIKEKNKVEDNIDIINVEKQLFECPVCLESFLPPIYQCLTGHNICKSCKNKVAIKCPLCKEGIGNTRNFALEDIVFNKLMSCKNSNCTFSGKGSDIQKHQEWCDNKMVSCLFSAGVKTPCNDSMKVSEMYSHVVSKHNYRILKFDEANRCFIITKFRPIYVIKYMSRLFRLLISRRCDSDTLCWSLQLIGNSELCKQFKFVVNINIGKNSRCLEGPCVPVQPQGEYFVDPKNFINSYCDRELLCYPYSVTILDVEN